MFTHENLGAGGWAGGRAGGRVGGGRTCLCVQDLSRLLYNRHGGNPREIKQNILNFNGFVFPDAKAEVRGTPELGTPEWHARVRAQAQKK